MGRLIFVSFGLLVVAISLSGTGADFNCPSGWSSYDRHCYRVFSELKTWDDAESFCYTQHKGSRLASIHSSEEEAFVGKLASQTLKFTSMWIGLNNPWKECKWEWSDDTKLDYKVWTRRPYCTVMVVKTETTWSFSVEQGSFSVVLLSQMSCGREAEGGHLASIQSLEESAFVARLASSPPRFFGVWIGLSGTGKAFQRRTWQWSDGSPFGYQSWKRGEPNNFLGIEYCVELSLLSGYLGWNDQRCRSWRYFVCKFQPQVEGSS